MNTEALELARIASVVALRADTLKPPADMSPGNYAQFNREMAVARTHLETAALWLFKASGAAREHLR